MNYSIQNQIGHFAKRLLASILLFTLFSATLSAATLPVSDQFTSSMDGYSTDDGASQENGVPGLGPNGFIKIEADEKTEKIYDFGSTLANTTVTGTFRVCLASNWNNGDEFKVKIKSKDANDDDLTKIEYIYTSTSADCYEETFSAIIGAEGELEFKFESKDNSTAYVDYVRIEALNTQTVWIKNASGTLAYTSPQPYGDNVDITETLTSTTNSSAISVTVSGTTESGYDYLYITDSAGTTKTYDGSISDTYVAVGPTVTIRFTSDVNTQPANGGVNVSITDITIATQAISDTYTTNINTTLSVSASTGILGNDTGTGISVTSHTNPANGTLALNSDGSFTYTPNPGFSGTDSFNYTITDASGTTSSTTVTITVSVNTSYEPDGTLGFIQINPQTTQNVIGDFKIMGNTVLCLTTLRSGYATSEDQCVDTTNMYYDATSNNYVSKFIDIDGNASTWNSSSSYITLPDTYQQNGGKGILWAGMVWQGRFAWGNRTEDLHYYTEGTSSPIVHETGDNTGVNSVTLTQANANKIRLKIDNGNYNQVTAYKVYSYTSSDGITYSAIADVTSLLQNANLAPGKHTFTVANLPTEEGREWSPGIYGGWSLVVIYAEDPFVGKPRNITIYGGMGHLVSKDSATPIEISGFKLPSSGSSVTASLAIFSGEGEHDYTTDGVDIGLSSSGPWTAIPETGNNTNVFDAVLSNVDRDPVDGHKNNLQNNNVGIDVDYFDISNIVTNFPRTTTSFYLRWWSYNDYIIPGMIAFSTELYRPSLCYDYTLDVGGIVIPSSDNQIKTSLNKYTSLPLTTRLTIRSNEADFVLHDVNITYGIADVNQTQYINDSVKIAPDGIHAYLPAANQTFYQRTDGFGLYIGEGAGPGQGGSIDEKQTIFVKFDNDLNQSQTIDTSFILRAQYTVDFGSGPVPQAMTFTEDDICNDRGGYFPAWGRFNTTSDQADQTTGKPYNLYTQVANRPFSAEVFSFEPSNTDSPLTVDTNIELEVINAGHFSRDVNLTCLNPDSNITVPVFVSFDNSNHTSPVGMNINKAIRNTAFRTWHIEKPDGTLLEHHCTDITDNDCFENIYTSEYTSDGNCTTECSTNIASGTDSCYKCLKTYYGVPICSRDNFAIRPEAFSIQVLDSDESNISSALANTITDSFTSTTAHLVAGYKYRYDVNATNFADQSAVPGYIGIFDDNSNISSVRIWSPSGTVSGCDTSSKPLNTVLFEGSNIISGIAKVDNNVFQVGEYVYELYDQEWTRVDWNTSMMTHHTGSPEWNMINNNADIQTDCIKDSNLTRGTNESGQQGCAIASIHDHGGYLPVKLQFHPYTFDVNNTLNAGAGPNSIDANGTAIYINTLRNPTTANPYPYSYYYQGTGNAPLYAPLYNDEDMSYNIRGLIRARDYTNTTTLTNFIGSCYAESVDVRLPHTYLSALPTVRPALTYDLIDVNSSNPSDIIRPREQGLLPAASAVNTPSDLNITQNAVDFRADMQGTVSMDLGFNFDRDMNLALNPRHIRFGDINVSLRNGPNVSVKRMTNYKPYGLKEHTQDVYFYYGRARSSKGFYEDVTQTTITTPISVVIYCDAMTLGIAECNNRGLNTQTDEYNWWKAVNHDTTNGDGDIALSVGTPTEGSGSAAINLTPIPIVTNGENNSVTITRSNNAGTTLPLTVPVDFVLQPNLSYTDRWLLYNEFNNSVPSPFYKVRFIGNEGWAGTGDTGHVVEHNASKRKNQRLGW